MSGFLVVADATSLPFFEAAAVGRLMIKRCTTCGRALPPQARRCTDSDELSWETASGAAVLVTWAVDHVPPLDHELASPDGRTSTFGIVELDEGPWLQVPIVGCEPSSLAVGIAMHATFIRPGDGEALPAFTPGLDPS